MPESHRLPEAFEARIDSSETVDWSCLLALELSRHRTTSYVTDITIEEQNWIYKVFWAFVEAKFSMMQKKKRIL